MSDHSHITPEEIEQVFNSPTPLPESRLKEFEDCADCQARLDQYLDNAEPVKLPEDIQCALDRVAPRLGFEMRYAKVLGKLHKESPPKS